MKKFIYATAVCIAMGACTSAEEMAKSAAESAVASMLKDPDSAKFSNEYIARTPSGHAGTTWVTVCGLVNGKNSFGAYSGGARFLAVSSETETAKDPSHPFIVQVEDPTNRRSPPSKDGKPTPTTFESAYWNVFCVDANHPPMATGAGI